MDLPNCYFLSSTPPAIPLETVHLTFLQLQPLYSALHLPHTPLADLNEMDSTTNSPTIILRVFLLLIIHELSYERTTYICRMSGSASPFCSMTNPVFLCFHTHDLSQNWICSQNDLRDCRTAGGSNTHLHRSNKIHLVNHSLTVLRNNLHFAAGVMGTVQVLWHDTSPTYR